MCLDDLPHNRESQAGSLATSEMRSPGFAFAEADISLEHSLTLILCHAWTLIRNRQPHPTGLLTSPDRNRCSRWRKTHRVGQKVGDRLFKRSGVTAHIQISFDVDIKRQALLGRSCLKFIDEHKYKLA